MIVDGLELLGTRWRINPRPCDWIDQWVLDEYEVGVRAAKVWSWGPHYCPPEQYARIRRDQAARDAQRAAEPPPVLVPEPVAPPVLDGQLELFAEAS